MIKLDETAVYGLDALNLAFMGDAVWHLVVREFLVAKNEGLLKAGTLNARANKFVNANAQAALFSRIESSLTEPERDVARRARNANAANVPKSSTLENYKKSTSFEAVVGYNYLINNMQRVYEFLEEAVK